MNSEILFLNEPDLTNKKKNQKRESVNTKDKSRVQKEKIDAAKTQPTKETLIKKDEIQKEKKDSIEPISIKQNQIIQENIPNPESENKLQDEIQEGQKSKFTKFEENDKDYMILYEMNERKNKEIKKLKKVEIEYDFKLNSLLENVNDAIEQSNLIQNNHKGNGSNSNNINDINYRLNGLTKEKENLEKQLESYKKKYEYMQKKSVLNFSNERIIETEGKLSSLIEENEEFQKKISLLKQNQNSRSKDLDIYFKNKEFPEKINKLTEQLNHLVSKKFENISKVSQHKKSLKNMKNYLENVKNLWKIKKEKNLKFNPSEVETIEKNLKKLEETINIDEDTMINMINSGKLSDLNIYGLNFNEDQKIKQVKRYRSQSPTNQVEKNSRTLPIIGKTTGFNNPTQTKSLNKFEFFAQKERDTKPNFMKKSSPEKFNLNQISKIEENKDESLNLEEDNDENGKLDNHSDDENLRMSFYNTNDGENKQFKVLDEYARILNLELQYDYENSNEDDFTFLIKKNEDFIKINENILRIMQNIDNVYKRKTRKCQTRIKNLAEKTNIIKQQNDLLLIEIEDLNKIYKLEEKAKLINSFNNQKENLQKNDKSEKPIDKKALYKSVVSPLLITEIKEYKHAISRPTKVVNPFEKPKKKKKVALISKAKYLKNNREGKIANDGSNLNEYGNRKKTENKSIRENSDIEGVDYIEDNRNDSGEMENLFESQLQSGELNDDHLDNYFDKNRVNLGNSDRSLNLKEEKNPNNLKNKRGN